MSCFNNYEDGFCLDASTSYAMAPLSGLDVNLSQHKFNEVPNRIYSLNPNAKIIYILRNPIERTYSGYWHNVRTGREKRTFEEAIKNTTFYLDVSNYIGQIKIWLKYYSFDHFLFVIFEDLKKNPQWVADECFKFLGINSVLVELDSPKNKSYELSWMGKRINNIVSKICIYQPKVVKFKKYSVLLNKIIKVNKEKTMPQMDPKEKLFLQNYFYEKNIELEKLIGKKLRWQ
ncbi:sulfotransferase protein [Desulfocucumis palustris]|uniref:Sulfotransferase protein n=1 Tax=Desulfocucumis palustris TaxID=1898651 RepID=A0A2L2XCP8_9FIRM|nr:sulfotransferase protein [Desulfocucumis palustris]